MGYSRRDDPTPVRCLDCGWTGRLMDCYHTYRGYDYGEEADVEPVDRCPTCGGFEPETITVWLSS